MKCIKTLNELLAKTLCLLLIFFALQTEGYGQRHLSTIDVAIADVQYVGVNQDKSIAYNVVLDIEIELSKEFPLANVTEFDFDIRLDGGFDTWLFSNADVLFCNAAGQLTITPDATDNHLFNIHAHFPNGISEEDDCMNFAAATSALIVDSSGSGSSVSADCYDENHMMEAIVEITKASIMLENATILIKDIYIEESFLLPGCEQSTIETARAYDINIVLSSYTSTDVSVDVYFRYSDGTNLTSIKKGDIYLMHNDQNLAFPTLNAGSPVNAALQQGPGSIFSILSFDNASIIDQAQSSIYLGTLTYSLLTPEVSSNSQFSVTGQIWDQSDNMLSSNVTFGFHDDELFSHKATTGSGVPKLSGSATDDFSINVHPVPAQSKVLLNTNFDLTADAFLNIYDINGRLIDSPSFQFSTTRLLQFNVDHLNKGFYLVELISNNYISKTKILID